MNYNPDVLSCLANLSNDEVFTPPAVVNQMLDLLPQELFASPKTKFLDPATKSGVFLREITKRLIKGLENEIPDLRERVDHILQTQVFGIATTELTSLVARRSLYCSKYPNCKYSVSKFDTVEGNVRFRALKHTFVNGRCKWCGASASQFDRDASHESHAYEFIHTSNPEEIFNMKFDVIISNPPYQINDGGNGVSARPIYNLFVEQAKNLNPRYLVMIIPARWYTGGKGLDEFRATMLSDKRIRKLVDYENYREVFSGLGGLAGGVCYFLWDRERQGKCEVVSVNNGLKHATTRSLDEYDIFIRQNLAIGIVKKITSKYKKFLNDRVSSRKPFGLPTNYQPTDDGIPCWYIQKIGLKYADRADVVDTMKCLNKWKYLIPPAPIAGQTDFSSPVGFFYEGNTRIAKPGECCSESWLVAGAFDTLREVLSYKSYILTKIVRFLLLQTVVSQHVTKKNYCFIPDLGRYEGMYTDLQLCKMWDITEEEWRYIDSRIGEIGG